MSVRRSLGYLTVSVAFALSCSGPQPTGQVTTEREPTLVGAALQASQAEPRGLEASKQPPPAERREAEAIGSGAEPLAAGEPQALPEVALGAAVDQPLEEPARALGAHEARADELTEGAEPGEPARALADEGDTTELVGLTKPPSASDFLGAGSPEPALAGASLGDAEPAPEHALVALRHETHVFERPNWRARKIGYLRAGARLRRSAEPRHVSRDCKGGWYQVEPQGYVCVGNTATTDLSHPVAIAARVRPDRSRGLPYTYGLAKYPPPPLYTKLPTKQEQARVEPDGRRSRATGFPLTAATPPSFLAGGRQAPTLTGASRAASTVYSGRALGRSGFAFISQFEHEGRHFGLTAELAILPLDRLRPVPQSELRGLPITGEGHVAFNRANAAALFAGSPREGLKQARLLTHREAVELTGESVTVNGARYLKTLEGLWLRDSALTRITPMRKVPGWATEGRTWIDISILKQTLVAYVGRRPVFATLVSTGADGLGDPEKTRSTVQGQFLIHTKHVTAKMGGDEPGDEFELKDVPYVQYFNQGYALHAAYWHDGFGRPRSHGCINLAPEDARWLFQFTDPPVPQRWHGAMATGGGTLVHIHP